MDLTHNGTSIRHLYNEIFHCTFHRILHFSTITSIIAAMSTDAYNKFLFCC